MSAIKLPDLEPLWPVVSAILALLYAAISGPHPTLSLPVPARQVPAALGSATRGTPPPPAGSTLCPGGLNREGSQYYPAFSQTYCPASS